MPKPLLDTLYYKLFNHDFLYAGDSLALIGTETNLKHMALINKENQLPEHYIHNDQYQRNTCNKLSAYFSGEHVSWPRYTELVGTAMQQDVWQAIAAIPYGHTISYTELAKRVHKPQAIRAAASACGKNPLPVIIPCHRVLGKGGALGGFSLGGIHYKKKLLALEGLTAL